MVLLLTALPHKLQWCSNLKPCNNMYTNWVTFGPVSNLWTGNRNRNPVPRKGNYIVGTNRNSLYFVRTPPCTLRRLMLAALSRLPQTSVMHYGSLCIFWYGKDTAKSLQEPPHHSSSCDREVLLLLWYWQASKRQQQIQKNTRRGAWSSCRYCWHSFIFLCCPDMKALDELSEGGTVWERERARQRGKFF